MTPATYDNLLAIDTATDSLHLALLYGGDRSVKSTTVEAKTHGQLLFKRIDELFGSAGIKIGELDGLVVSVGPGSFTGLRIGIAAAKGLAVAGSIPVAGVSLFEIAAAKLADHIDAACVLIPSRRGEFYAAVNDLDDRSVWQPSLVAEDDLARFVGERALFGIGFESTQSKAGDATGRLTHLQYDATELLSLGREKLLRGELPDLAELEPAYLQKAIAEIRFDERSRGR